ncbi:MAG: SH3 domain-containing protein [Lachnospiraceae bacterium]|nr:SH3 domain-containing protein [Lachnospiraceae bacterium]
MDNFREWVSDNLRYIMLICAIAVVCIGIFFGVRAITGRMSAGNSGAENTGAAAVATGIPAEEIESGASLAESAATLQENKIPEVSGLVTTYYMALNSKNVESVRAISDNLSDQDVKDIENSETEYSDIKSYIKQGPEKDDSSYVVYASYEYINPSLYVKHPGLSWLYVKRNDAGEYKIIVDASSDEKLTAYVNEISAEADVKALVDEITEASKKADADEQAAAEAAGTAQADAGETESAAPESPTPEAEETPKEETAGAEEAEQAPAAPEESEEEGQEEDTESEESLGYNNEFPDDGAPEHSAVIGSTCNLRAGAGYNYKVVTVLEQGTPITVIGEVSKGWYHISCEAGEGYIGTRFVDFG